MTQSSFYTDGPQNTMASAAPAAPASFYSDPTAASNSATQAAASAAAALASQGAAHSSETNAGSSATAAANSASNSATSAAAALTSQNAAGTSEANAASSATAAATSASGASSSASAASGSATAASTSASNASASATAASTSASNAATSATNAAASVQAAAGTATPLVAGTAAVGTGTKWAHEDHRHPVDTATPDARIALAAGTVAPTAPGTAATGTSAKWAHEDHVHPKDSTKADLASPTFTGAPLAPTAATGTNTTQLATTAFVAATNQFTQTGTGAVVRSYQTKLADRLHARDFGVSASSTTTTGTISASSTSLTLAAAIDFVNGQGIAIEHAGAAFATNPPTGVTVAPQGTAGATTYSYRIAAVDAAGGVGAAVTAATTATGNAALSTTNYNKVTWTAPAAGPAPLGYAVYGRVGGSEALLAFVCGTRFDDVGIAYAGITFPWLPTAPQASALADRLVTTISSGAGTTTLTLAAAATTAATSVTVSHDDTAALQAAVTESASSGRTLHVPPGQINLTAAVNVGQGAHIVGAGLPSYYNPTTYTALTNNQTWFVLNHSDKGFVADSGALFSSGNQSRSFRGFGTFRPLQPEFLHAPYTPGPFSWDIYLVGCNDVVLDEILILNPTAGINSTLGTQGSTGRITFGRILGQPISIGIQIDYNYDVSRLNQIHFWPFWRMTAAAVTYTATSAYAIVMGRVDNFMADELFFFGYWRGIQFFNRAAVAGNANGPGGTAGNFQIGKLQSDSCGSAIAIDAAADGVTGTIGQLIAYGANLSFDAPAFSIDGTNASLRIQALKAFSGWQWNGRLAGTGSRVQADNVISKSCSTSSAGTYSHFAVGTGAFMRLGDRPEIDTTGSGFISGAGSWDCMIGRGRSTGSTTDASGNTTITHGLGFAPQYVKAQVVTSGVTALFTQNGTPTSTTFSLHCINSTNAAALVGFNMTYDWEAFTFQ